MSFKSDDIGPWIYKDADAKLDYAIDWNAPGQSWLVDDTIQTVVWTVPVGIVLESQANTNTLATVWLSGGTVGAVYSIACKITTAGGRTDERTFRVKVIQR